MAQQKVHSFLLQLIGKKNRSLTTDLLLWLLYLASWPYRIFVGAKALFYRWGILRGDSLEIPVISVGNITVGGTGKTPLVCYLAQFYQKQGFKPAILLRGYKGKFAGAVGLVTDGQEIFMDTLEAGDEAVMMAHQLSDVPILVGADRFATGGYAQEKLGVDLIILDDGFQNFKLTRDLDLVTIDSLNPFGYGHVLPRGLMREPKSALGRAHALILTHVDQVPQVPLEKLKDKLTNDFPAVPIIEAGYEPIFLRDVAGTEEKKLDLSKKKIVAFSGIGNPRSFEEKLSSLGGDVIYRLRFSDHHKYTEEEILQVFSAAFAKDADMIITTEKDAISLPAHLRELIAGQKMALWVLGIEVSIASGKDKIVALLKDVVERKEGGKNE